MWPTYPGGIPPIPPIPPVPNFFPNYYGEWDLNYQPIRPTDTWRQTQAAVPRAHNHPYARSGGLAVPAPYGHARVPFDYSTPNTHTQREYGAPVARLSPPAIEDHVLLEETWRTMSAELRGRRNETGPDRPLPTSRPGYSFTSDYLPKINMSVAVSSTRLDISWTHPPVTGSFQYKLTVKEKGAVEGYPVPLSSTTVRFSVKSVPGQWYNLTLEAQRADGHVIATDSIECKSVLSSKELAELYEKACKFTGTRMHPFQILYRCKPKPYWDDIHHNRNSVMEKYMKDNNGQPGNLINECFCGLFFSARLTPSGELPGDSPFGNVRMLVKAFTLLDPDKTNFYFADFYCNESRAQLKPHYVTIIITQKNSDTDEYCNGRLILLDPSTNPFLRRECRPPQYEWKFFAAHGIWVEIFYTEHVPLSWGRFDMVAAKGAGTSRIGGIPNDKHCNVCNLYPPIKKSSREKQREKDKDRERDKERDRDEGRIREEEKPLALPPPLLSPPRASTSSAAAALAAGQSAAMAVLARQPLQEVKVQPSSSSADQVQAAIAFAAAAAAKQRNVDVEESPAYSPLREEETLVPYESGSNSTFETLINISNTNDYPNWTDLIESVCGIVDEVCTKEKELVGDMDPLTLSQRRIDAAIAAMNEKLLGCANDKLKALCESVYALVAAWRHQKEEIVKALEGREKRRREGAERERRQKDVIQGSDDLLPGVEEFKEAVSFDQLQETPRRKKNRAKKGKQQEQDLNEYLDDDDNVVTADTTVEDDEITVVKEVKREVDEVTIVKEVTVPFVPTPTPTVVTPVAIKRPAPVEVDVAEIKKPKVEVRELTEEEEIALLGEDEYLDDAEGSRLPELNSDEEEALLRGD